MGILVLANLICANCKLYERWFTKDVSEHAQLHMRRDSFRKIICYIALKTVFIVR